MALGLGSWLFLEIFIPDVPFEPQLVGLLLSLIGMIVGSYLSPNPYFANKHGLPDVRPV
jgi:hypothetical protein